MRATILALLLASAGAAWAQDSEAARKKADDLVRQAERFAATVRPSARSLSDAEAQATCAAFAQMADAGRLGRLAVPGRPTWPADEGAAKAGWTVSDEEEARIRAGGFAWFTSVAAVYKLRLASGASPMRFASLHTGGTCHATQAFSLDHLLKPQNEDGGVDPVDDPEEKVRWAYWGGGDYPVFHRGRYFMVTADLADPNRVGMVSWIKPDGRQRRLCLLSVENLQPEVVSAQEPGVCEAIASKSLAPLEGKPITGQLPFSREPGVYMQEFEKRYGRYADEVSLLSIDIDGDGKAENVGTFGYSSGAGCGSEHAWLSVLSDDWGAAVKGPLATQLGELASESVGVYRSEGRYYVASLAGRTGGSVVRIRDGRTEQVCRLRARTQTTVTHFFGVGR